MNRGVFLIAGAFVLAVIVGVVELGRAQPGDPTIEQILQVWTTRQEKVATARFELKHKEVIYKGSNWALPIMAKAAGKQVPAEPDPPRDYEVEGTSTVSLDAGKMRYAYDMPVWCPRTKTIRQEHYETAFDGHLFKSLQIPASGEHPYPLAQIRKLSQSGSATLFHLLPLTMTFRGHHEQFIRNLPRFEVTGRTVPIRGRLCLELVAEERARNKREVLHLDKERGYVVVRKTTLVEEKPTWQVDVTHTADPLIGWVPRSWEYITRVGKERMPTQSGQVTVVKYELNGPVKEGEYDITFPAGTRVVDTSSGPEVQYVIRDDGTKGKEIPLTQNPTYEDLLQPSEGKSSRKVIVIGIASTVVALCLGLLIVFRRRHRNRPFTPTGD